MTDRQHPDPEMNRQRVVEAGTVPVLVELINFPDADVQYYCITALSNIATDGKNNPFHS